MHCIHRKTFAFTANFHIADCDTFHSLKGNAAHGKPIVGICKIRCCFVRRGLGGNDQHSGKPQLLHIMLCKADMSVVYRVKGSTENSYFFHRSTLFSFLL